MRRTRLTAAGAAAVLALGGTVAGADDHTATQTVTIEVEDLPLRITTNGSRSITLPAGGDAGSTQVGSGTPTIDYSVPSTGDDASISAALTDIDTTSGVAPPTVDAHWPFGDLKLWIQLPPDAPIRLAPGRVAIQRTGEDEFTLATGILDQIPPSTDRKGESVTYSLEGTAPSSPTDTAFTITFTIAQ